MPLHFERVRNFKAALTARDNEYIIDEFYHVRSAAMLEYGQEAELRRAVATRLDVEMRDVLITGSAKLGFNLVGKPRRPPLSPFNDQSDIDVAVISEKLFVSFWSKAFIYLQDHGDWSTAAAFRKYLARGWIRPDKLPKVPEFPDQRQWFEFFQSLTASGKFGPYAVNGGVYFNESFWKGYARSGLNLCRASSGMAL